MNPLSELSYIFHHIDYSPRNHDLLASQVSEVAAKLIACSTRKESTKIQTLIGRVFHSHDTILALRTLFLQKITKSHRSWSSAEQKAEAAKYLLPCLAHVKNDECIPGLVEAFSNVPQDKIENFQRLVCSAVSREQELTNSTYCLCADLSPFCWQLATALCNQTEDADLKTSYISTLQCIPSIDNFELEEALIEQLIPPRDALKQLLALRFLPQDQILPALRYWNTLDTSLYENHYNLINRWLETRPENREPCHAFLLDQLQTTRNGTLAFELSNHLIRFSQQFHLNRTDLLYREALTVYQLTTDLNSPKNPYTLYAQLLKLSKKNAFIFASLATEMKWYGLWLINPEQIKRAPFKPIPKSALPADISRETLEALWTNFSTRVHSLDSAQRQATKQYIQAIVHASFSYLHTDNLNNAYLRSLFELPTNPEDPVSVETAYFFAILKQIVDTSNEKADDALLSPQEEMLLKVSCGIQACPTGRAEGICSTYHMLIPMERRYPLCAGVRLSSEERAWQFIWTSLQQLISEKLSTPGLLMEALSGKANPSQLSHCTLFLKNALGKYLGISQTIRFDPNSGVLPLNLVEKPLEDILRIFYEHLKPTDCVIALQRTFNTLSLESQQQLALSASALLASNPSLPQELMEGEDPEENLIHITYDEDYTKVQSMALSNKGAVYLLCAAGILMDLLPNSPLPLFLAMDDCLKYSPEKSVYLFNKLPKDIQQMLLQKISSLARLTGLSIAPITDFPSFESNPMLEQHVRVALYDLACKAILAIEHIETFSNVHIMYLPKTVQILAYNCAKKYCSDNHITPTDCSDLSSFFTVLTPEQKIDVIEQMQSKIDSIVFIIEHEANTEDALYRYFDWVEKTPNLQEKKTLGALIRFFKDLSEDEVREILPFLQSTSLESSLEMVFYITSMLKKIPPSNRASFIKQTLSLPEEIRIQTLESLLPFSYIENIKPINCLHIVQTILKIPFPIRIQSAHLFMEMIANESNWRELFDANLPLTTDLDISQTHTISSLIQDLTAEYYEPLLEYLPVLFRLAKETPGIIAKISTLAAIPSIPVKEIPDIIHTMEPVLSLLSPDVFAACIEQLTMAPKEERSAIIQAFSHLMTPVAEPVGPFNRSFSSPREHQMHFAAQSLLTAIQSIAPEERESILSWTIYLTNSSILPDETTRLVLALKEIPTSHRETIILLILKMFPQLTPTPLLTISTASPENQLPILQMIEASCQDWEELDLLHLLQGVVQLSASQAKLCLEICLALTPQGKIFFIKELISVDPSQRKSILHLIQELHLNAEQGRELMVLLNNIPKENVPSFCQQLLQQKPLHPDMLRRILSTMYCATPTRRLEELNKIFLPTPSPQKRKRSGF